MQAAKHGRVEGPADPPRAQQGLYAISWISLRRSDSGWTVPSDVFSNGI